MELSEFIKTYRKQHKLSMQQLADKCGITKGYVSMIEGRKNPSNNYKEVIPSLATMKKLAEGMNLELDDLLNIIDDKVSLNYSDIKVDQTKLILEKLYKETGVDSFTDSELEQIKNYAKFLVSQRKEGK